MAQEITFTSVLEGRLATYAMLSRLYRKEMDAAAQVVSDQVKFLRKYRRR